MDSNNSDLTSPMRLGSDRDLSVLLKWDRYNIQQLLGKGGMGRVYKAFDPRLKRNVALKFLMGDDPDVRLRFLQEPQAQARMDHPNVCKIYETGEVEGIPYIAMQYIDGHTLDALNESLSLQQKIQILRDVAEGVHAAHRLGIIHRDIKPANIMVENAEGKLRPYVMDFGLAREISAPGLTATGVILGTPWYMSPEQALGNVRSTDHRSDVYGLGATLYHLVCLRPPFDGTALEILNGVTREDPPAPRRVHSSVPEEIEIIILKCMEKDPQRRYDSAHALSEELRRYQEGKPILARAPSLTYRLAKTAKRNRLAVAIGAAALVVTLSLTGMWLRARWTAAEQAALAQQIGQKVEKLESTLRNIHMLPLHDTSSEKAEIRKQLAELAEQIRKNVHHQGTANFALGRVLLAQEEYKDAADHLQKAWDNGYRSPEVAYALGRALGSLYRIELENVQGTGGKLLRRRLEQEAERRYSKPALVYLRQSQSLKVDSPEYIEALISFCARDYDAARRKAAAAFQKVPWLYEARVLEGDALLGQAHIASDQGDFEETEKKSLQAVEAFREAARIGQSDASAYKGLCIAWNNVLGVRAHSTGKDVEPAVQQMEVCCAQAARADPSRADVQSAIAESYRVLGDYYIEHGQDSRPVLQRGLAAAKKAMLLEPLHVTGFVQAGSLCWELAKSNLERGENPQEMFDQSIRYLNQALKLQPDNPNALNNLGLAYLDQGYYYMSKGLDPLPSLEQSARGFRRVSEIAPEYFVATLNLGIVLGTIGEHEKDRGGDPVPSLEKTIETLREAEKMNPKQVYSFRFIGYAYRDLGEHQMHLGMDPQESFEKAIQVLQAGLKMNPKDAFQHTFLASVYLHRVEYMLEKNESPSTDLELARLAAREARSNDPDNSAGYELEGVADLLQARLLFARKKNPMPALENAQNMLNKAFELNKEDPSPPLRIAECHMLRAEKLLSDGRNADLEMAAAHKWIDATLRSNPEMARAYGDLGFLLLMQKKPAEAQKSFARAIELNKNLERYYAVPTRWPTF